MGLAGKAIVAVLSKVGLMVHKALLDDEVPCDWFRCDAVVLRANATYLNGQEWIRVYRAVSARAPRKDGTYAFANTDVPSGPISYETKGYPLHFCSVECGRAHGKYVFTPVAVLLLASLSMLICFALMCCAGGLFPPVLPPFFFGLVLSAVVFSGASVLFLFRWMRA